MPTWPGVLSAIQPGFPGWDKDMSESSTEGRRNHRHAAEGAIIYYDSFIFTNSVG